MRGGGNMQQMMKQMQKMQKKMAQEQEKLKRRTHCRHSWWWHGSSYSYWS